MGVPVRARRCWQTPVIAPSPGDPHDRSPAVDASAARADAASEPPPRSNESRAERAERFQSLSGEEIRALYTEDDLPDAAQIGLPGAYPFTRGVYPSMYRGRLWTMRQFAGFGTALETNERFRYLLDHGQTGLSTAFDMPSLMGHDSDSPLSLGEVGREGVAIDTLDDMADLFAGIDLRRGQRLDDDQRAGGDHAGVLRRRRGGAREPPRSELAGTIQADILKEYIAQKEWCFPIDAGVRLQGDMIEWCTRDDAALAPGLDLRLPHPRGRLDRRPGARFHAQERLRLRRRAARPRPGHRQLRPAAVVLLQRPDRLLRGDRQVPRRPPDLGARAARDATARATRAPG